MLVSVGVALFLAMRAFAAAIICSADDVMMPLYMKILGRNQNHKSQ
jgi:hypothetical protein